MSTFRPPRWGAWALAFALLATGLYWLTAGRGDGSVRLAGGNSARVIGVTFGTNHVLETGPPWARLAHRLGARGVARRFGYKEYSAPWPARLPCLMVWVAFTNPSTNPIPRYASVADMRGAETEPSYQAAGVALSQTNETIAAWRFENFPRRQRRLLVRFYHYDLFQVRARHDGELAVQNPVPVVKPGPPMPPSPVSLRDGPLECSLSALRGGEPPPPVTSRNSPAQWASAEFALRENGRPTTAWTVKRFEALGADGNRIVPLRPVMSLAGERRVVRFAGPLWPDEPGWQVDAEFVRVRDFPAEGLWTFRLAGAHLASSSFATNLTAAADGLEQPFLLQLQIGLSYGVVSAAPRQANLALKYKPADPDVHLSLARATDDAGRECLAVEPASARQGWLDAQLKLPVDALHVDLVFALHRSRKFTFRIRPTTASTNSAPADAANPNQQ
jgi:hypothetical protein